MVMLDLPSTPEPEQTVKERARLALTIMDRDGWNKGYMTLPSDTKNMVNVGGEEEGVLEGYHTWNSTYRAGSHCIGGLWNLALHGDNGDDTWVYSDEVYKPLNDVIGGIVQNVPSLIAWNNDPDTTEQDVRRVLESLANA